MEVIEFSNFEKRDIPKSCPKELRAKVEAAREQRSKPVTTDTEEWGLLKSFAAAKAEA